MTQQELIEKNLEKIEKMKVYDQKMEIANNNNKTKIADLVDTVNEILSRHGIKDQINSHQIRFNADYIGNISWIEDKKLSRLIFDKIYPQPTIKTFSHYTSFDKGLSIITQKQFWLFNLLQNFDANEFKLFYQEHGIDGYENDTETLGIWTGYRPLMSEIFALCLTIEDNQSPTLWDYFSENGTGLKLTFEIESTIPDFREVYYSNMITHNPIPLLKDLFTEIKQKFNYQFNFTYMSKIGAFYIMGKFKNEKEYRFLIKRTSDDYNAWKLQPITFQNDISYIVLPFESKYAKFKLIKVQKGPCCDPSKFNSVIQIIERDYPSVEIVK